MWDNKTVDKLSIFDKNYENLSIEKKFEEIKDGRYQVQIFQIDQKITKKGAPMLCWRLKILAPNFIGRILFKNNAILNETSVKFLKQDLLICGIKLKKLTDLQSNLINLLDLKLEITKVTKNNNQNIYFNKLLNISNHNHNHNHDDYDIGF